MKKYITSLILALIISLFSFSAFAGTNPPDPPGHGQTGDQPAGGSAPIGGGLFILLGLGAVYGGKKIFDFRKSLPEETTDGTVVE